jgi:transcriptional regulator with GAF, ATPase, and Fis domain
MQKKDIIGRFAAAEKGALFLDEIGDIPLLSNHFIEQFSALQGKDIVGIASAALNILMRYDYPGNIRELDNIIRIRIYSLRRRFYPI